MKQFEHKLENIHENDIEIILKKAGEKGWELVSTLRSYHSPQTIILFFKREKVIQKGIDHDLV